MKAGEVALVNDAVASFERNIEAQTGKSVGAWVTLVSQQGLAKHGQMVAWLKTAQGLSHSHSNHVAKRALELASPRSDEDPVGHLFAGGRAQLRALYDQLVGEVAQLGPDVEVAPKKSNVSLRRRRQFALVQPTTLTRLDLGLILKGREAHGRLEASGSFNAMFTHRVKLAVATDIDDEVLGWLQEAYREAG